MDDYPGELVRRRNRPGRAPASGTSGSGGGPRRGRGRRGLMEREKKRTTTTPGYDTKIGGKMEEFESDVGFLLLKSIDLPVDFVRRRMTS